MLSNLRDIAFRFQIDPQTTIGHAARITSVISVLHALNRSYQNFIQAEFLKNEAFASAYEANNKIFDPIREDLELLLVDVQFGSFEAAAAPNLHEKIALFNDDVLNWKRTTFDEYKYGVLYEDFNDPSYLRRVLDRYSDEERAGIFQPLFSISSPSQPYQINLIKQDGQRQRLRQPSHQLVTLYTPKAARSVSDESDYQMVQFFAKVRKDVDARNLTKRSIQQVLFFEPMEHETYPYKPDLIQFGDTIYVLSEKLSCTVTYEDESYVIRNDKLDLTVWGDTREAAEDAFGFAFHSLYQNFAQENDESLSNSAKLLKRNLLNLVKITK